MKYILCFLLLVGCGGSSPTAYAEETLPLYITNITTVDSVDVVDVQAMVAWVTGKYEQYMGVKIVLAGYEEVPAEEVLPDLDLFNPDNYAQQRRLWGFHSWLVTTGRWHKKALNYGVLPHMDCNGMKCFGGMANFGCEILNGTLAIGQAAKWSSHTPPRPRVPVGGGIVLAHECGHGLDMFHISIEDGYAPNIMDQAAGRFVDTYPELPFLSESVAQMQQCVVKAKKKRLKRCNAKPTKSRKRACRKRAAVWMARKASTATEVFPIFE